MDGARTTTDVIARHVIDGLLEGCQVVDAELRYLYVNDAVLVHGRRTREELLGRTMMECYPGIEQTPMFETLRRCMETREHARMENRFTYPDGSEGWFELRFVPVPEGVCILSLDVTDQKRTLETLVRTEAQLAQAQKMEAIGRLAGGVAHDFNNILSVILSYSAMLLDALPPSDPTRTDIDAIHQAGRRGATLTHQLLTMSRQRVREPRAVDVDVAIRDILQMVERLVGADVEIVSKLDAATGSVRIDPGHLDQILVNLVVNARDAMPKGGTITIESSNVELDAEYAARHLGVTPGPYVMIVVSDTGMGMTRETLAQIFEPFFTTKPVGSGTGLGLSTVFGIARKNGGAVWVYSEPERGATFKVYLPRVDTPTAAVAEPVVTTTRGTETLLLVEDDPASRDVAARILSGAGYEVLTATNGEEAERVAEISKRDIALLLTDVIMPKMSGIELARRLGKRAAGLRVLFTSGYTDDAIAHYRDLAPNVALLAKPITPRALLERVRAVLDAPVGSSS